MEDVCACVVSVCHEYGLVMSEVRPRESAVCHGLFCGVCTCIGFWLSGLGVCIAPYLAMNASAKVCVKYDIKEYPHTLLAAICCFPCFLAMTEREARSRRLSGEPPTWSWQYLFSDQQVETTQQQRTPGEQVMR